MTNSQTPAEPLARQAFPVTAGDINIWHARLLADQQVTYVLEFARPLAVDRLRQALAVLNQALPLLGCVVQVSGRRLAWVPLAGGAPLLNVAQAEFEWPGAMARFISQPANPEREPPLKLFLLRRPERDTLAIKVDHMLTDAAGLKFILGLLSEAYSTGSIHSAINPDRGFGQLLRRFSLPALLGAARQASLPRPARVLAAGPFQTGGIFIEHACLEPEAFARLHAAAKGRGATINDAILAAVYRAVFHRLDAGAEAYPLMVPVDLRRYLPETRRGVVGNLSSALYPLLAPWPNETTDSLLARVQDVLEPMKKGNPGLGAMLLMAVGALWGGEIMRRRYEQAAASDRRFINVTNFGVIGREQAAFEGAPVSEAYGVGPEQNAPGILLALSTYAGTLHFVIQSSDRDHFQPFVRGFLRDVLDGLSCLSG